MGCFRVNLTVTLSIFLFILQSESWNGVFISGIQHFKKERPGCAPGLNKYSKQSKERLDYRAQWNFNTCDLHHIRSVTKQFTRGYENAFLLSRKILKWPLQTVNGRDTLKNALAAPHWYAADRCAVTKSTTANQRRQQVHNRAYIRISSITVVFFNIHIVRSSQNCTLLTQHLHVTPLKYPPAHSPALPEDFFQNILLLCILDRASLW